MYSCSDLKKGLKIMIDGEPHVIAQFDFTKPGKGQALYKCKLRVARGRRLEHPPVRPDLPLRRKF